jgi:hypothetical protein
MLGCVNKSDLSKKSKINENSKSQTIEIKYSGSREKTIESLRKIWDCETPLIAKKESNFNGKMSNNITIMITDYKDVESEKKELNIELTIKLMKENILNYNEFSELKIITSYTTSNGERRTSSKTIKTTEL